MGELYITVKTCTNAQTDICSLIIHGVLRIDTYQTALCVLTVERSLRTTQDIHTVDHVEVVVERSLRHEGDIIVIDTHSRAVYTRANATDIHRRREARAIRGHHKRGHVL